MVIQKKRIGILTGGGDVPPLNAVIKSVCKSAEQHNIDVIGFKQGWKGLISKNGYIKLNSDLIDGKRGGTFLKSSRVNLKKVEKGAKKALLKLGELDIQTLIVIGGEDTLSNSLLLERFPQILISKTIDNDVGRIDNVGGESVEITNYFTLGFPTAVRKIVSFVSYEQGLRTTAYSHERIIVVESMGMHAGWLALSSCLGKPDFIIIPEFPFDYERFLSSISSLYSEQRHIIVVVSEGAKWGNGLYVSGDYSEMDNFGHPRFRGAAEQLCYKLKKDLSPIFNTRNINFVNPSYLYRSGAPCDLDLEWARKLGHKAVDLFMAGLNDSIFLSIQRDNRGFIIEPYSIKNNIQKIDDFHRFVPEPFYNPNSFSATNGANEYFKMFV